MTIVNSGGRSVRQAFSLLELLAVVTIMAIIASVIVPRIGYHAFGAKQKACYQYRRDINLAIERYIFENNAPPNKLSDLIDGDYYPNAIPKCPADQTEYKMDLTTYRIIGHNH